MLNWMTFKEAKESLLLLLPEELAAGEQVSLGDGYELKVASTFLEPTYARQVFPCFDEPHLKAEFTVSASVALDLVCISNMPIDREKTLSESKKLVVFQKSPPMSTYLVGLVAGPFSRVASTQSRIPLSILYPIACEVQDTEFALDVASRGFQLFEELFDFPYPLPKLDLVTVPALSVAGMEGIITDTVLHELAHMWFGNLVTMKDWEGLWLKEGLATLMSTFACAKIFQNWYPWNLFVAKHLQRALDLNALHTSRPLESIVQDSTSAKQMYDQISYDKAACVFKMILDELGEEMFLEGLGIYLHRHKFGIAESEDLWRAWEDCAGAEVVKKMRVWTRAAGFPVLEVTEQLDGDGGLATFHFRQQRFLASGLVDECSPDEQIYPLRIAIRTIDKVKEVEMNDREMVVQAGPTSLLKVNTNHGGFFRTSYSPKSLQNIIAAASGGQLNFKDCIGLTCDLGALVAAGIKPTSDLLDLCFGLLNSGSFYVWETINDHLRIIRTVWKFHGDKLTESLNKAMLKITGRKARELGWEDWDHDGPLSITSRTWKVSLFLGAGLAGDETTIAESQRLFERHMSSDKNAIPAFLRGAVLCVVAAHGGPEELQNLVKIWEDSMYSDVAVLQCLGLVNSAELVREVIDLNLNTHVKIQHWPVSLSFLSLTSHGAITLWKWAEMNWDKIEEKAPVNILGKIVSIILVGLHTEKQEAEVREFFAARDTTKYRLALEEGLERMRNRKRWAERDLQNVTAWLEKHGYL
ncbi:hypothetical protein MKZ38_008377 [Zalerion maritima]|uniref:Aminopeptidase n=1 Tax=Zalerion maritima TaxID=339359 RepID=A0AAD5RVF4_9PEZI|nr:hypothetical protein MKZ38_008377 [Zalerion maritima]